MECRHLLAPAAAGLLLVAGARARADDAVGTRALQVAGGDFPALVMVVPDPGPPSPASNWIAKTPWPTTRAMRSPPSPRGRWWSRIGCRWRDSPSPKCG